MTKILLVEDDRNIVKNLKEFLHDEGFDVKSVSGQAGAEKLINDEIFDLALLDISLNDGNGYAVCSCIKQLRKMPVIFLSASGDEFSVVTGLDMGADDYIAKPFRPRELVARIKNVLRRSKSDSTVLKFNELTIDTVKGSLYKNGNEIFLSALEYKMLLVFFNNIGAVLSRQKLLEEIWDIAGEYVNDNTLTVYIKRIREKIEDDPTAPMFIKTVRGIGYKVGE